MGCPGWSEEDLRPPVSVGVRLPPSVVEALDYVARKWGTTRSVVLRAAVYALLSEECGGDEGREA